MKTIIFDFDGTIADSSYVFMHGWNAFADQYGYKKVDERDIASARGLTLHECAKRFHFPMMKMPIILPKIYRYYNEHISQVSPYVGIADMLKALKAAGHQLVILSSNEKKNIDDFLAVHALKEIDLVLSANKLFGKDRALKRYMRDARIDASNLFYLGDELRDLEACQKCGIAFGWVSWGLQGEELIAPHGPTFKFYSPMEITDYFK